MMFGNGVVYFVFPLTNVFSGDYHFAFFLCLFLIFKTLIPGGGRLQSAVDDGRPPIFEAMWTLPSINLCLEPNFMPKLLIIADGINWFEPKNQFLMKQTIVQKSAYFIKKVRIFQSAVQSSQTCKTWKT